MSSSLDRLNAALSDRYVVERQLGEGGMATVYLATDVRHDRRVALKVLKPQIAAVVGADRFLSEIRTTANLQHPHILPLFDSGKADGMLFYVMPYVEGESLGERLDRERQLPVDEAVRIVTNVAEALDYAHSRGVIHRDIKPANILLQEGKAIVADFGIALALSAGGAGRLTETGLSLGTPHYMSPEQATGDIQVGPSTDIYALGCVLYEMLTGEPPYTGSTPQAILGKIIQSQPVAAAATRSSVPVHVDAAVRRSVEKLPADRFASAGDFAKALADPSFRHGGMEPSTSRDGGRWRAAAIGAGAGALLGALVAVLLAPQASRRETARIMRFVLPTQGTAALFPSSYGQDVAISHDGRLIVHVGTTEDGGTQLFLRSTEQEHATPVPGTEGGIMPFFSPDGTWIGFAEGFGSVIKRIPIEGGAAETVGRLPEPVNFVAGGTWTEDGQIIVGTGGRHGLFSLPAEGGTAEQLTSGPHHWPFAVGSDAILFMDHQPDLNIAVLDRRTGDVRQLGIQGTNPLYLSSGHLVYVGADGSLQAVRFDRQSLEVVGSPVLLRQGLDVKPLESGASLGISQDGHLVYTSGVSGVRGMNLVLVTRNGTRTLLTELPGNAWYPRFSPDGTQVAYGLSVEAGVQGLSDLWAYDLARAIPTRVTFSGDTRYVPTWTPDGRSITHADGTADVNQILTTMADGSGLADTVLPADARRFPTSWSPDGRALAIYVGPAGRPTNTRDVAVVRFGEGSISEDFLVATPFEDRAAFFSPDGRSIAYVSDRSGRDVIYVRPFPGPGAEITVSAGDEPVWSASGTELFFRTDTDLLAVTISSVGGELTVGRPAVLFRDEYLRDQAGGAGVPNYDVSPSGDGFVMVEDPAGTALLEEGPGLHLVLNFTEELRARLPN